MPPDHISNAIGAVFESMLREEDEFSLHLGAGGSAERFPNCIEFEHKIFRHTDGVGDAHRLPFRDDLFDHVVALNVFENRRDPKTAAAEILRVLKPGGRGALRAAAQFHHLARFAASRPGPRGRRVRIDGTQTRAR